MKNSADNTKIVTVLGFKTELNKHLSTILPAVDIVIYIIIFFTSINPWITLPLCICFPLFGILSMKITERINKIYPFYILSIVDTLLLGFICYYAGSHSPGWIVCFPLITATLFLIDTKIIKFVYIFFYILSIVIAYVHTKMEFTEIVTIVLALAVFIAIVESSFQYLYKQQTRIESQKNIIEIKSAEITDSIRYAKRIQQAKLPNKEEIYSLFPQSFVLFKPKDIVSGDFYFFHKKDQSIFIASADCTGHGVPGAFMSMIGSEKLEDAVSNSTDTSEILKQLNKGIKFSLHQSDSDESTRDGMDIALCSVDKENRSIKFAGANRPIWIIRNGQEDIEEIKGTKSAVGGSSEDNQHFDTHVIQLQRGDTFYISTDGYADTFGGQKEKKLTTKKFKEILLSIQNKSLKEQGIHLDNYIEDWKGEIEQVDDILVIGVRL